MKEQTFKINYAGNILHYSFTYPATRYQFHPWPCQADEINTGIHASHEQIDLARTLLPKGSPDPYVEFRALIGVTAKELLKYDCCIFHGVAFVWKGKAFLLTAPSGTGKTTQFLNWQRLFPDEITMICGDMPVLERRDDGNVWAHPSSWNGKENLGNRISAPIAGIIFLAQHSDNEIHRLSCKESLIPFFEQFIVRPDTEEQIRALSRIIDQILRRIPIWRLSNNGDDASTALLRNTLMEEIQW